MKFSMRLLFVLLIAFVVRLVLLNQSFWLDEAAQALESIRPISQQLQIAQDFQPPLFHLFVHVMSVLGVEEAWLRMSSLVSGLVTIAATYGIAQLLWKKEKGKEIGLLAALFLSFSTLHVFFSQELRPYVFAAMWGTLGWYFLLRFLHKDKAKQLVGFVLSTIAGLYSMYLYPFLFISQLLYVWIFHRAKVRSFAIAAIVVAVSYLPWLPSFFEQLRVGSALRVTLPGWSEVVSLPQWKALPLIILKFIGGVEPIDLNLKSLLFIGVPTVLLLWAGARFIKQKKVQQQTIVLGMWLVLPIFLAWLASFVIPVLSVKRVLFGLPAFYLLAALAFTSLTSDSLKRWVISGFLLFQVLGLISYWTTPQLQRERWREAHQQIYGNYSVESTIVVFAFDAPFAPWRWYDRHTSLRFATLTFPKVPVVEPELSKSMEKSLNYKTVLVFDYLLDLTDPSRQIHSWLLSHGYETGAILDTFNMGFVREYQKASFLSGR